MPILKSIVKNGEKPEVQLAPVMLEPEEKLLTGPGTSKGARLSLVNVNYGALANHLELTSAFVYSLSYDFDCGKICKIDDSFFHPVMLITSRRFKDYTIEKLGDLFLARVKDVPFVSRIYQDVNEPILYHGFPRQLEGILRMAVSSL